MKGRWQRFFSLKITLERVVSEGKSTISCLWSELYCYHRDSTACVLDCSLTSRSHLDTRDIDGLGKKHNQSRIFIMLCVLFS